MRNFIVSVVATLLMATSASAQIQPPVPVPPIQGQPSTPPELRPGALCAADLAIGNVILRKLARPGDLDVYVTLRNNGPSLWSARTGQVCVNVVVRNAGTGAEEARRLPLERTSLPSGHGVVLRARSIGAAVSTGPLFGSVRTSIAYSANLTPEPGACANDQNTTNNTLNVTDAQMRDFISGGDREIAIRR